MLSRFALRGARLFFTGKPLPLRRIGGDSNKMRESSKDHRRLSLLIIFFHFCVTRTGIASRTVQHATCVLSRTAKHNLQVVHFFQILW